MLELSSTPFIRQSKSYAALVVNTRFPYQGEFIGFGGYNKTYIVTRTNGTYESRYYGYLTHWPSATPLVLSDDRVFVEKKIIGADGDEAERLNFGSVP